MSRLWKSMSKTEKWVWAIIVLVAVLDSVLFLNAYEGVAILMGAISWRLIWLGAKTALRVARRQLK